MERAHITILEDNTDAILSMREGIVALLPSLWLSLNPIFNLEEETESCPWCAYSDGKLLLYSIINLRVKNQDRIRSITSIKKALFDSGIEGILWDTPLNTYSILVGSSAFDFGSIAIELFAHADISYLFFRIYIYFNASLDTFDAQDAMKMSFAYFDFINKHGLLSMNKGIVQVDVKKSTHEEVKTPNLYNGLYKDQD
jgi:hypothetical protein